MFPSRYSFKMRCRKVKLFAGSLNHWFWLGTIAILIFSLWYGISLFVHEDSRHFVVGLDIANAVGWFLGALFCLGIFPGLSRDLVFNSAADSPTQIVRRWFPLWIALVFFINCVGFSSQVFYAMILHVPLAPWWIYSITLLRFPCLLCAILTLSGSHLARITRVRIVLDGLLILTALVTFSWYFLLGPAVLQNNVIVVKELLGGAYPCIELFLCYCLVQLVFRKDTVKFHSTHWLLLFGLIGMVISDSVDIPRYALQATIPGYWFNLTADFGYLLIALSVQSVRIATRNSTVRSTQVARDPTFSATSRFPWRILVPYLVVPAVLLLMIYIWRTNSSDVLALGVYIGGVVLITQVLLRQIFITQEAYFYNRELQRMQQTMYEKNLELSTANQHLEERTNELAQAYEHQRQVNDLKDQFLLNVNHELRTPLTEIYGYLDLLRTYRGNLDEGMQATFLDHALHGSEELLQLINSTLDALHSGSKAATSPQSEDLVVAAVVREVQSLFELTIQQNYQLELLIPDTLKVRADRQYLHQVLRNLLSNAFKYSPIHTRVELGAQCEPTWDGAEQVLIWVQDAGPGIPPGDIPLLFGKFVRLQRDMASAIRGTGLGLYISRQLVEAMGGHIWVESLGIAGKGSRFCFTLPAPATCKSSINSASSPVTSSGPEQQI